MWSRSWEYVPGMKNPSPLRGEKQERGEIAFHGFRRALIGPAPPMATTRRPAGALEMDFVHVLPVSHPTSREEPRNGIALNPLLHRAHDFGLLGILPVGKTAITSRVLKNLRRQKFDARIDVVRAMAPGKMMIPHSPEFTPPDDYLVRGLKGRGWMNAEIKQASQAPAEIQDTLSLLTSPRIPLDPPQSVLRVPIDGSVSDLPPFSVPGPLRAVG